jgi:hypothetical protein
MRSKAIDPEDVIVVVGHPFADVEVPLRQWIAQGPAAGPRVRPIAARSRKTGKPLPLRSVPLRYRNNTLSRTLILLRVLQDPWR